MCTNNHNPEFQRNQAYVHNVDMLPIPLQKSGIKKIKLEEKREN